MLPSYQRLSRIEVTTLREDSTAHVVFNRVGTLRFLKSDTKGCSVVVSKKHQKKAVARNVVRRRIYTLLSRNPYFTGFRGVLLLSVHAYSLPYEELKDMIDDLLKKTQKNML